MRQTKLPENLSAEVVARASAKGMLHRHTNEILQNHQTPLDMYPTTLSYSAKVIL